MPTCNTVVHGMKWYEMRCNANIQNVSLLSNTTYRISGISHYTGDILSDKGKKAEKPQAIDSTYECQCVF